MKEILKNAIEHNYSFWVFGIFSIILIIVSFIIPPVGDISPSVLTAVGELFGFAALGTVIKAIDKNIPATVQHGETVITVGKDSGENVIIDEKTI